MVDGGERHLNVGIAGLGMAANAMIPSMSAHPQVRLVAAADTQADLRNRFAEDFGAAPHASVESLCADPSVEVVYIATPHQFHLEHALAAARCGKHIILEKPLALTLEDCVAQQDGAPRLTLLPTDYGFVYGARRNADNGMFYWRVTQWLLPMYSLIPSPVWPRGGRAWVPIDDERTWTFAYTYNGERPLSDRDLKGIESGAAFPPRLIPGTFLPLANKSNDWLIDRAVQRTKSYSGIWGVNDQDRSLQESMGPILDRTIEHLGSADLAVIQARRILLRAIRELQNGSTPAAASNGALYQVRAYDAFNTEPDFGRMVDTHREDLLAPA